MTTKPEGPWRVLRPRNSEAGNVEIYHGDHYVCQFSNHPHHRGQALSDAERIVACLNAFEGMPTNLIEEMPAGVAALIAEAALIMEERDRLLAALVLAHQALDSVQGDINPERGYADQLEAEVLRATEQARDAIEGCTK